MERRETYNFDTEQKITDYITKSNKYIHKDEISEMDKQKYKFCCVGENNENDFDYFIKEETSAKGNLDEDNKNDNENEYISYISDGIPIFSSDSNIIKNSDHSDSISDKDKNININPEKNKKKVFNVIYEKYEIYNKAMIKTENMKRIRNSKRISRKYNRDNIRKKIKVRFFNHYLYNKINNILKEGKTHYKNFERFPQKFINDINKKSNKEILNETLREIIGKKEFCESKRDLENYKHNMNILTSLNKEKNLKFEKILNMEYQELFEIYINSDEFKKDEMNKLKKNNDDLYIERYIYLSNHLIEYFNDI